MAMSSEPTPDEEAGMAWWNALSEADRTRWLQQAGTAVPAIAWACYKGSRERSRETGKPATL